MKIFSHTSGKSNSLFLCCLGNFISCRIHNHRRMVEILFHHIFKILFPPVLQFCGIIIFCLVNIPDIHILIHHQHSLTVTGIQKCSGARIMRRTDGIVSVLLQNTYLSLFCFRKCTCSKKSVVVMNTGSPENHPLSVYGHSLPFIPVKGAHSKMLCHLVVSKCCI